MSAAQDAWSFFDLSNDWPPATAVGARVSVLPDRRHHILSLTVWFAGPQPSMEQVDRVLRDCAAYAAARDSAFDVFARAQWLPRPDAHYRENQSLYPHGNQHFLCFDARLRQVGVRAMGGKRFVKPWPVEDIASVCRQPYAEPAALPLEDYEDADDPDGAESGLRAEVVRWIWYGYHAPERITQMIDEQVDEDGTMDADTLHAFAAAVLAKKRAAEASWPETTDNDRLVDAFADLLEDGIFALQWAGDSLDEGFDVVNEHLEAKDPSGERFAGACFFHAQDIDSALNEDGLLIAFGHLHSDDAEDYEAIGRRVVEALRHHGLAPRWNGTARQRIALPDFRWQRRTPD